VTPSVAACGVAGVKRGVVMEVARDAGIRLIERALSASEVLRSAEVILSNSVIGVWRVRELAGRELTADAVWRRLLPGLAARGVDASR
jgi:4-amino-4-deoxychorismate lyase